MADRMNLGLVYERGGIEAEGVLHALLESFQAEKMALLLSYCPVRNSTHTV